MRGADLLIHSLNEAGVTTFFSLSGNQIMPVYDACFDTGMRIVHTRHEGAAAYMADAWAQITSTIGVALVAGGPGFCNSMSPLFSARHAESPVLFLSGDSPLAHDGLGAFQELDQTAITSPLVKAARRCQNVNNLAHDIAELIDIARSGRPGPVHLALPFDLLEATTSLAQQSALPAPLLPVMPADIDTLIAHLDTAQRPVVITGPHCNDTRAGATLDCVRATGIPVVPMESPRGLKDPMLGTFSDMLPDADLVVIIGKKLDFTLQFGNESVFPAHMKIAVIDPETDMVERAQRRLGDRLVYSAHGDSIPVLNALAEARTARPHTGWQKQVDQAISNRALSPNTIQDGSGLLPQDVCMQVQELIERAEDPILICDGGEFGQWAQAFCHAPTRIINGISGAIGGSLPYAIAVKIARPRATVIAMLGDGTAGFHLAEFDTAVRENTPFIAIVGNDYKWNAEHLIQIRSFGEDRTFACSLNPDAHYENVAQALGGSGSLACSSAELSGALNAASAAQTPVCINVPIQGLPAPVYASDDSQTVSGTTTVSA